jgi:zinc protease
MIFAGHLAPPRSNPDEVAIETMNTVFGGAFTSRVNMNLREEKGWSYGAFASLYGARGQRPYFVYAPVQTDKTKESVEELRMELRGILGEKPIKAEELEMAKGIQTLTLAGQWETLGAVRNSIAEMVRYDLPEDYFEKYPSEVNALEVKDLEEIAGRVLHPEHFVWVVVGDREQIESGLRELGFDEIRHLDTDGNPAG